jgi:hypothetical protein
VLLLTLQPNLLWLLLVITAAAAATAVISQEVYDTNITTEDWRDMVGNALFVGNCLPIDTETELLAVNGIDEDSLWPSKPTDQEYEAYTGNAGPSLE